PDSGYSYFTPINPGDPDFDTAGGVYFDGEHLPSCYDYSSGSPTYHTGGVKSPFWPYINEERYSNLHNLSTSIFESNCGNRGTGWNDWYPSSFSSGTYWRQDGSTSSYTYTPPGVHIVLTDTPDIILITDSDTNDDPAEYDSSNNSSFISYPTSPIIYAPGDIRIEGIIPAGVQMTVVSGGNIYIESNIYQDSTSSLALLAKKNVIFNTTHRWVVNSPTSNTSIAEDEWTDDSYLEGYTNSQKISASVTTSDTTKTQTVDFGGGTNNIYQTISANRIILRDCDWTVTSGTIELHLEVSLDGSDWIEMSSDEAGTTPVLSTDTNGSGDIDAYIPTDYSHARVFRYIKLILEGNGDVGDIRINSLEVVLEGIEGGVAVFSEEEEWAIIPGNVSSGLPLVFNVALSEKNLEDKTKWNSKWPNISYTYGSTLDSNPPPHLPPSVNLISLRRK
ncbi:MAG: hypothetical protein U9O41_03920, partial [Candidatus Aerophobetes bacterium]|nr:hypothetical protein [Candidatus Aerophobetes bacterium]